MHTRHQNLQFYATILQVLACLCKSNIRQWAVVAKALRKGAATLCFDVLVDYNIQKNMQKVYARNLHIIKNFDHESVVRSTIFYQTAGILSQSNSIFSTNWRYCLSSLLW